MRFTSSVFEHSVLQVLATAILTSTACGGSTTAACAGDDACSPAEQPGSAAPAGTVQVFLTDAPADVTAVIVELQALTVRDCDGGGWLEIPVDLQPIDLMTLQNGIKMPISDQIALPTGDYCEFRLRVADEGTVHETNGTKGVLKIPGGSASGVKFKGEFSVVPSLTAKVLIDFDAGESLHKTGQGRYQLHPVLRFKDVTYTPAGADVGPGKYLGQATQFTVTPEASSVELFGGEFRLEFPPGSVAADIEFVATLWQSYSEHVVSKVLHVEPHHLFLVSPTVDLRVPAQAPSESILWDGERLSTSYVGAEPLVYARAQVGHFSDGAHTEENGWASETCYRTADTTVRREIVSRASAGVGSASPPSTLNGGMDTWLTDVAGGDGLRMRNAINAYPDEAAMMTAFSTSDYPLAMQQQLVTEISRILSLPSPPSKPTNDQETLDFLGIRQQCFEFAVRIGHDAGGAMLEYGAPGVADPADFRPGMGMFRPKSHAAIITDIRWVDGKPVEYRLAESNYKEDVWANPPGQVPWQRTVSARTITEDSRTTNGYNVVRFDDGAAEFTGCEAATSPVVSPEPACPLKFPDVSNQDWFHEPVMTLACAGVIEGIQGSFVPDGDVTRAEFLKLVLLTAFEGVEDHLVGPPAFSDIDGHWAEKYIDFAAAKGIVTGSGGAFSPDAPILRGDAATILVRAAGVDGASSAYEAIDTTAKSVPVPQPEASEFPDVRWDDCADPAECYYYKPVYTLRTAEIMCGYQSGAFGKIDHLTRAQAAKIVCLASGMCSDPSCDP